MAEPILSLEHLTEEQADEQERHCGQPERRTGGGWITVVVYQERGEAFRFRLAAREQENPPGTKLPVICVRR